MFLQLLLLYHILSYEYASWKLSSTRYIVVYRTGPLFVRNTHGRGGGGGTNCALPSAYEACRHAYCKHMHCKHALICIAGMQAYLLRACELQACELQACKHASIWKHMEAQARKSTQEKASEQEHTRSCKSTQEQAREKQSRPYQVHIPRFARSSMQQEHHARACKPTILPLTNTSHVLGAQNHPELYSSGGYFSSAASRDHALHAGKQTPHKSTQTFKRAKQPARACKQTPHKSTQASKQAKQPSPRVSHAQVTPASRRPQPAGCTRPRATG